MNWQKTVKEFIAGEDRIVILGIGNIQKGDDAAGSVCARNLIKKIGNALPGNLKIIDGGEIPENFTGDIRQFNPSRVLIIDAVIAGHEPGTIFIADPKMIENTDVSTHRMPLSMLCRFMEESIGCKVIIIGIEAKEVDLDITVSKSVQNSTELLINHLFVLLFPKK